MRNLPMYDNIRGDLFNELWLNAADAEWHHKEAMSAIEECILKICMDILPRSIYQKDSWIYDSPDKNSGYSQRTYYCERLNLNIFDFYR